MSKSKETEKSKDETPNLKVSDEVDLGYTDHPQKDEKKLLKPQIETKKMIQNLKFHVKQREKN